VPTEKNTIFGKLAVERGYATQAQVDEALAAKKAAAGAAGFTTPLSQAMVGKGMLTRDPTHQLRRATAVETDEARVADGDEAVPELSQGGRGRCA